MDFLMSIWSFSATNILTQPAYFIGLMVLAEYLLPKKPLYEAFAGFIKTAVGYMVLAVGSGGLVNNFRPILVGLKDRFNLDTVAIDPYFGQDVVTAGLGERFDRTFSQIMLLLLITFAMNSLLVCLRKWTKIRAVFTTGHAQMQQASTAFWLILFCLSTLRDTPIPILMGLILGLYWAVGSNLIAETTQELIEGGGFAIAHQQISGIAIFVKLADKPKGKSTKRLDDLKSPGFLSTSNGNMVATSILMFLFSGAISLVFGKDYLVSMKFIKATDNFFFYTMTTALNFAVYLVILQLGVRTFVTRLTNSFQGISNTLLPGAVPGIDCAAVLGFGSANAVTVGFLMGALGQFLAIMILSLMKSPTLIIAGFVPVFFDNAVIAIYADNRGSTKVVMLFPFIFGLIQIFGSALIAGGVGLAAYGGYFGMFDWATIWPLSTVIMKFLGYFGVAVVVLILLAVPQLQYRKHPDTYSLITEDYDEYLEKMKEKEAQKA